MEKIYETFEEALEAKNSIPKEQLYGETGEGHYRILIVPYDSNERAKMVLPHFRIHDFVNLDDSISKNYSTSGFILYGYITNGGTIIGSEVSL